jgi:hypothetical protein
MKGLLLTFILLASSLFAGNACVSTNVTTTASNVATTWNYCGGGSSLARDSSSVGPYAASGTSTWSHTIGGGSNMILFVAVSNGFAQPDGVTGVTDNGTPITLVSKFHGLGYNSIYMEYGPSAGTHTIVVSSTSQILAGAVSYSGAKQSSQPDSIATATGTTITPSVVLTTVSPYAWGFGMFYGTSHDAGMGGTTVLQNFPFDVGEIVDTNGAIPTTGAHTFEVSGAGANRDILAISIIPDSVTSGTTPQTGDTVTIATPVVLKADLNVVSMDINGATAQLTTDGSPHTITTTGGVTVTQGCSAVSGACTTANAIDTSGASAGNEVTWTRTGATTGQYVVYTTSAFNTNLNLSHSIFNSANGRGIGVYGGFATMKLTVNNSKFVGGEEAIDVNIIDTLNLNNISSTGLTAGPFLALNNSTPTTCTTQNMTVINPLGNLIMVYGTADFSPCSMIGNVLSSDPGGVYAPQMINANFSVTPAVANVWTYNLAKSYYTAMDVNAYGLAGCAATVSLRCIVSNNVIDSFNQNILSENYMDSINNVTMTHANIGAEQGSWIGFGSRNMTQTGDIVLSPASMSSNAGVWYLGIAGGGMPVAAQVTMSHYTAVMALDSAGDGGVILGEGVSGSHFETTDSAVSNSILYGGLYGITAGNPDDTFVSSGTGGVGLFNNDYFGNVSSATTGTGTHMDDGVHAHPNAVYGDVSIDPKFVDINRSWDKCDALLGGPGTTVHLFDQMFNRWNGSNPAIYTPQNVYNCMRVGFAPHDVRLATGASDGSYIGAVKPVGMIGMAFTQ